MHRISFYLLTITTAILFAACNSTDTSTGKNTGNAPIAKAPSKATASDGVRRITPVELQQLVSKGEAFVVDVRNDASYKQGHIKGARLIPTNQILQRADELPQDKVIVTYCSWPAEQTSAGAAVTLRTKGINNTAALLGGYEAWRDAGLPVETAK